MPLLKRLIEFVMDILETITFVGSLFIVIYLFIMGPNQVKGNSMVPTFHEGDYILTSKVTYKFRPIQRGDIVVFKSLKNKDVEFIKRVIALPGDQIFIQNGEVYLNSKQLKERYIADKTYSIPNGIMSEGETITVPEGSIFVFGDNRPNSSDSREFGSISILSIVGEVFYRYYPPGKIGWIAH